MNKAAKKRRKAALRQCAEMLRRCEVEGWVCPICGWTPGHLPGCELVALREHIEDLVGTKGADEHNTK
jgi:hypothetical protein